MVVLDSVFLFLAGWLGWRFFRENWFAGRFIIWGGYVGSRYFISSGNGISFAFMVGLGFSSYFGNFNWTKAEKKGIGKELKSLWGTGCFGFRMDVN